MRVQELTDNACQPLSVSHCIRTGSSLRHDHNTQHHTPRHSVVFELTPLSCSQKSLGSPASTLCCAHRTCHPKCMFKQWFQRSMARDSLDTTASRPAEKQLSPKMQRASNPLQEQWPENSSKQSLLEFFAITHKQIVVCEPLLSPTTCGGCS